MSRVAQLQLFAGRNRQMRRSMLRRILAKRHLDYCGEVRGFNLIGDEGFVLLAFACVNVRKGQEIVLSMRETTCGK